MAGIVRLRGDRGSNEGQMILSVPVHIANHLRWGMMFRVKLIPEGILYQPVGDEDQSEITLPEWVENIQS